MGKRILMINLFSLILLLQVCTKTFNNPIDEGGDSFDPPTITIDKKASSISNGDTIHFDSASVVLTGNREQSRFRVKVAGRAWTTDWKPEGSFTIWELDDGSHTIVIQTKYDGGEKIFSDSISFNVLVKGYKPEFDNKIDSTAYIYGGNSYTLKESAICKESLKYSWIKYGEIQKLYNEDSLIFDNFSIDDTGKYRCFVQNDYGSDSSRLFKLRYLKPEGGIVGNLIDSFDGTKVSYAEITLLPDEKKIEAGKFGKFEFKGYAGGIYSLKITASGYKDTTIEDIRTNDTIPVELNNIIMRNSVLYNVTFNGNGHEEGEAPEDDRFFKPGSEVLVAGNIGELTRRGYSFSGWNTKNDGSGDSYNENDTLSVNDNITLYADWSIISYKLSYDGNENTSGEIPEDKEYEYNSTVKISGSGSLEREGYLFKEWNTKEDGSGKTYLPDSAFIMPDNDINLYAQWTALPTHILTYNKNSASSGNVPIDSIEHYVGKLVTIKGNPDSLEKEGFLFAGWNTEEDGSGDSYTAGSKLTMPDYPETLYVQWTDKPTYSITYQGNGNSGGEPPATVTTDSGVSVTIADAGDLVKTGYVLDKWNSKEDGSGKEYAVGQQILMDTVNINLYAQWKLGTFKVIYDGNGSTGGTIPPTTSHIYQSDVTVSDIIPIKMGYTLIGWNTDSDGGGLDYTAGNTFSMGPENITLYARWTKKKYQITFKGNGDNNENVPDNLDVYHGSTIQKPELNPIRRSYVFNGWYKDPLCTIEWVFSSDIVISDDTLFAGWVIKDIDGNTYTEVKIGSQVWMVENLKVTRYNDSTSIERQIDGPLWKELENGAYCWYGNDSLNNKKIFGALYNWHTVKTGKLAPSGWRVATQEEWETLVSFLGGASVAGGKLKEPGVDHWNEEHVIEDGLTGFMGLGGGSRLEDGSFNSIYYFGNWWTSTEGAPGTAYLFYLSFGNMEIFNNMDDVNKGLSVRCIRDW